MSATTRHLAIRPVGQRLRVDSASARQGARQGEMPAKRSAKNSAYWSRMSVGRLRDPLDQLLITAELVLGGILTAIGGAALAFHRVVSVHRMVSVTGMRWGAVELLAGLAMIAIAMVAVITSRPPTSAAEGGSSDGGQAPSSSRG